MAELRRLISIGAPSFRCRAMSASLLTRHVRLAAHTSFKAWFKSGGVRMPIQTIATYRVKPSGVDKVKRAIAEFVPYVKAKEPGTQLYVAWQQKDDPTRFVHFFIFANEAAHAVHASSDAVKKFEAAYRPELSEGGVVFTDYEVIATNQA
jgi:quinol monooxygenase YgiN